MKTISVVISIVTIMAVGTVVAAGDFHVPTNISQKAQHIKPERGPQHSVFKAVDL